ncbi:Fe-S oxidoreductase [Clostridium sp. SY8519]|uniref:(Fe-S)-binding protein n=1 Tax=Clostridium sp. (strain SY8519) TaxID=1042156 RepID=UPI0002171B68|nr:(Fe-S)-binding protein [Clostridium sp. SY8519]BAK47580.1 Fe-S oxidoreductase [Clostridium sp. SY8519]
MALIDYKKDQFYCNRCSNCKFIPSYRIQAGSPDTINICPAMTKYNFHAYSGSGKLEIGYSINDGHSELCETSQNVAYKCTMCGACDYHCKVFRKDIDVIENIEELRKECVNAGLIYPEHQAIADSITNENNQLCRPAAERIDWSEGLSVKRVDRGETGTIYFYAGDVCGYSKSLAERTNKLVSLLYSKNLDLVVSGAAEPTAADKAFDLGFTAVGIEAAKKLAAEVKKTGAKTIVTTDAHAYMAFNFHYPRNGVDLGVKVMHITQLLAQLIEDGLLTADKTTDLKVTYQDPCNLGRRSEPFKDNYYGQNKRRRPMELVRTGDLGEYQAPRAILAAIPGVELIEMNRIKGWAYCCGNGAGVAEVNPDLLEATSKERMAEAAKTGADALVTACPMCEYALSNASDMKVIDIIDLVLEYMN